MSGSYEWPPINPDDVDNFMVQLWDAPEAETDRILGKASQSSFKLGVELATLYSRFWYIEPAASFRRGAAFMLGAMEIEFKPDAEQTNEPFEALKQIEPNTLTQFVVNFSSDPEGMSESILNKSYGLLLRPAINTLSTQHKFVDPSRSFERGAAAVLGILEALSKDHSEKCPINDLTEMVREMVGRKYKILGITDDIDP